MYPVLEQIIRKMLKDVRKNIPKKEFCGLGVVVYSDITTLPVAPLCPRQQVSDNLNIVEQLAVASYLSNPCHDGFHLLTKELKLTHINQYFAPPLASAQEMKRFGLISRGARYMSAQLGSMLETVICVGVVSEREGLMIFKNGSACQ